MSTLEQLLEGVGREVVAARTRSGKVIAHNDGSRLVVTLSDELQQALATASPERLAEVAGPWSRTEEFGGRARPELLALFLGRLAELARIASADSRRLYCWWSG